MQLKHIEHLAESGMHFTCSFIRCHGDARGDVFLEIIEVLKGCDAAQSGVSLPMLWGNMLPPLQDGSSEMLVIICIIYFDGGCRFLLNTGNDLPDYIASYPRKQ
jgi:hypothetical protein